MKITLIGPVFPYRGGIAHFTALLTKILLERGDDLQVITFKRQYPKWLYPGITDKDVGEGRLRTEAAFLLSPFNPLTWRNTINAISQFNPNIIVIQWWTTFWGLALGYLGRKLHKAGYTIKFLIHNCLPHEPLPVDKLISKLVLKYGHQFIVMNEREIGRLKTLSPTVGNIVNVPMPIFNVFPESEISKSEARKLFSLPQNMKLILFFGLVRPYKGLKVLITAFNKLISNGYDLGLVIAGEFWEDKNDYMKILNQKEISDRVFIFDRYITDRETSEMFKAADIFVAPYLDGTQSAAIKTAIGFGVPIIMSDIMVDKIISDLQDYVVITKNNDPHDLACGIKKSLDLSAIPFSLINSITENSWDSLVRVIHQNN